MNHQNVEPRLSDVLVLFPLALSVLSCHLLHHVKWRQKSLKNLFKKSFLCYSRHLFKSDMCSFCELAVSSRITKIIKQVPQTPPLTAISQINHRPRPQTRLIGWDSTALLDFEFSNKQSNVLIVSQCLYFSADLMLPLMHLGNLSGIFYYDMSCIQVVVKSSLNKIIILWMINPSD